MADTANLAAHLSATHIGDFWEDIEAATRAKAKLVCVHEMLQKTMEHSDPNANFHFRPMNVAEDLRAAVEADGCDAFVVEMRLMRINGWARASSADQVRCDLGFVATGSAVAPCSHRQAKR